MEQVIISRSKHSKYYLAIGILIVSLFILPYVILGGDSSIRIHDTLDGRFPRLVSFSRDGQFSGFNIVNPAIMNGITDNALGSMFNLTLVSFLLFKPFVAYVINALIVHLVAFIGMFLLLRKHFLQNEEKIWVAFGCSLSFALVPHMPLFGLSVVGQPLLLYAFLNLLKKRQRLIDYTLIFIFPFYSFLALSNIFIICILILFLLWDYLKTKQINKSYLLGVLIFIVTCGIAEYNLIIQTFLGNRFISHRSEWNPYWSGINFKEAIKTTFSNFVYQDTHAYNLHTPILLFSSIAIIYILFKNNFIREYKKTFLILLPAALGISFLILLYIGGLQRPLARIRDMDIALGSFPIIGYFISYTAILFVSIFFIVVCLAITFLTSKKNSLPENSKLLPLLLIVAFSISLFSGLYHWAGLIPVKMTMPFLKKFQMDRFYFLLPLIWYLTFALSLSIVHKNKRWKYLAIVFIVFQIYYVLVNSNQFNNFFKENVKAAYSKLIGKNPASNILTYKNFFSENLYSEIKDYIAVPQKAYRVVSIGLYPSIATYNGFYTLDAYVNDYPLEYKHRFRKIIENELKKSKKWREYFDYWGSRCYIFVAELENLWFENTKDTIKKINNLDLNTEQLKAMGGEYILSAFEIVNAEQNKLTLLKVFERNDSPWRIFLYKTQ